MMEFVAKDMTKVELSLGPSGEDMITGMPIEPIAQDMLDTELYFDWSDDCVILDNHVASTEIFPEIFIVTDENLDDFFKVDTNHTPKSVCSTESCNQESDVVKTNLLNQNSSLDDFIIEYIDNNFENIPYTNKINDSTTQNFSKKSLGAPCKTICEKLPLYSKTYDKYTNIKTDCRENPRTIKTNNQQSSISTTKDLIIQSSASNCEKLPLRNENNRKFNPVHSINTNINNKTGRHKNSRTSKTNNQRCTVRNMLRKTEDLCIQSSVSNCEEKPSYRETHGKNSPVDGTSNINIKTYCLKNPRTRKSNKKQCSISTTEDFSIQPSAPNCENLPLCNETSMNISTGDSTNNMIEDKTYIQKIPRSNKTNNQRCTIRTTEDVGIKSLAPICEKLPICNETSKISPVDCTKSNIIENHANSKSCDNFTITNEACSELLLLNDEMFTSEPPDNTNDEAYLQEFLEAHANSYNIESFEDGGKFCSQDSSAISKSLSCASKLIDVNNIIDPFLSTDKTFTKGKDFCTEDFNLECLLDTENDSQRSKTGNTGINRQNTIEANLLETIADSGKTYLQESPKKLNDDEDLETFFENMLQDELSIHSNETYSQNTFKAKSGNCNENKASTNTSETIYDEFPVANVGIYNQGTFIAESETHNQKSIADSIETYIIEPFLSSNKSFKPYMPSVVTYSKDTFTENCENNKQKSIAATKPFTSFYTTTCGRIFHDENVMPHNESDIQEMVLVESKNCSQNSIATSTKEYVIEPFSRAGKSFCLPSMPSLDACSQETIVTGSETIVTGSETIVTGSETNSMKSISNIAINTTGMHISANDSPITYPEPFIITREFPTTTVENTKAQSDDYYQKPVAESIKTYIIDPFAATSETSREEPLMPSVNTFITERRNCSEKSIEVSTDPTSIEPFLSTGKTFHEKRPVAIIKCFQDTFFPITRNHKSGIKTHRKETSTDGRKLDSEHFPTFSELETFASATKTYEEFLKANVEMETSLDETSIAANRNCSQGQEIPILMKLAHKENKERKMDHISLKHKNKFSHTSKPYFKSSYFEPCNKHCRTCHICKIEFRRQTHLLVHMHSRHRKSLSLECEFCEKKYTAPNDLENHVRKKHIVKEKCSCYSSQCQIPLCSRKAMSDKKRSHLHKTQNFEQGLEEIYCLTCDICKLKFSAKSDLVVHMKSHNAEQKKRTYSQMIGNNEQQKGFEESSFSCKLCTRIFSAKFELDAHCKSHSHYNKTRICDLRVQKDGREENENIRPFSCHICKIKFREIFDLLTHLTTLHDAHFDKNHAPEVQNIQTQRVEEVYRFYCGSCMLKFSKQSDLVNHLKSHCADQKRRTEYNLKLNIKTQTVEKVLNFSSDVCKTRFKLKLDLSSHLILNPDHAKSIRCEEPSMSDVEMESAVHENLIAKTRNCSQESITSNLKADGVETTSLSTGKSFREGPQILSIESHCQDITKNNYYCHKPVKSTTEVCDIESKLENMFREISPLPSIKTYSQEASEIVPKIRQGQKSEDSIQTSVENVVSTTKTYYEEFSKSNANVEMETSSHETSIAATKNCSQESMTSNSKADGVEPIFTTSKIYKEPPMPSSEIGNKESMVAIYSGRKQPIHNSHMIQGSQEVKAVFTFSCSICSMQFSEYSYLITHLASHEPYFQKTTGCHKIQKLETQSPYYCKHCYKKFREKLGLANHLLQNPDHAKTPHSYMIKKFGPPKVKIVPPKVKFGPPKVDEVFPFSCYICKMKFSEKSYQVIHLKTHAASHQNKTKTRRKGAEVFRFSCGICKLRFSEKTHLENHSKSHEA